jgi:hypothetical protein
LPQWVIDELRTFDPDLERAVEKLALESSSTNHSTEARSQHYRILLKSTAMRQSRHIDTPDMPRAVLSKVTRIIVPGLNAESGKLATTPGFDDVMPWSAIRRGEFLRS